ncbi:helix-turn-helix domain-containing protein [Ectopseudomonas toyotomiensis]|uniref:Helix-turn-helix n=1 Tax=Ectopseudomonas toyotomiensis TaxID=554344 RepID=A0A1I5Z4G3_9GAMM|nr:helix-turn-helix domain-containing protein [Pseudomonas toyotomiensis]SFQ51348.1 Helix-turn-helix [Pseudomonas toyotomiensis]
MGTYLPIGERLAEERKRLGFNQTDFAAVAGVSRKTLFGYESGERTPDAGGLAAWASEGVDLMYVVLGERSKAHPVAQLLADEQVLLEAYRAMPARARKLLLAEMLTGKKTRKADGKADGMSVSGDGNRVAGRDYNETKE